MANNLERFHYDPSKPIEPQIRAFLAGRNPYGQMRDPNWFKDPSLYQQYATPDESGTQNYGYRAVDPRLADIQPGAVGPEWNSRIIDGQYTPVGWSASDSPDAVNGLKPDSMYDYGRIYYDPQFGLVMDGNNVRDPDARHDAWYGAGLMAAVAGPAIAGIMGGAGAAAGAGEGASGYGSMTGIAGDESAGLAGAGGGGGAGAGGGAGGLTTTNNGYANLFHGAPSEIAGGAVNEASVAGSSGGLAQLGTQSPAPVTDLSTSQVPVTDLSVPAQQPSMLQQAGNFVKSNPSLVRATLGLASLGGAAGGGGGGGGSGGASGDAGSIIDQMAQANRVNQNTPIGSRAWSRDANGQWTVNDTMSPAEQANFENVQGVNSGVTGYTRDYLARLLSAPARGRADAPITINGRTIGG